MKLLSTLFGRRKNPGKPYVDAGMALTQRLVTSLNLPGWRDLEPTYSADELEAIEGRLSGFQQMANDELGGEVKFHPDALPSLRRTLAAEALTQLAGSSWKYCDEIPTNWMECAATYLKAWAAHLDPLALLDLGELLARAGYRSESKDTFRVVLLFPTYADTFYGRRHDRALVDSIVNRAEESLRDLG